jgi:hypothetical protein
MHDRADRIALLAPFNLLVKAAVREVRNLKSQRPDSGLSSPERGLQSQSSARLR